MLGSDRGLGGRNPKPKASRRQRSSAARNRETSMTPRRRVAITGIGMVTPVGNDAPTTWANLLAGRSGVAPIQQFDARGFPVQIGAEVKKLDVEGVIRDRKLLKCAGRSHRFAL